MKGIDKDISKKFFTKTFENNKQYLILMTYNEEDYSKVDKVYSMSVTKFQKRMSI